MKRSNGKIKRSDERRKGDEESDWRQKGVMGNEEEWVGVYLPEPVFTHEQLYVKVFIDNGENCKTRNIEYCEIFHSINRFHI
ncbi:hypothetical protein GLOIN_2v1447475 [Rhizophagus irregularis DAOM 181602=DAOM 197198]|nr:hypothetical protein GLOIN_2v1447475 [Rhizophagus irregularis DAOM 181602=DAOM 197198]GET66325.1 hypothetical protein GLOIN_2v1447475 [Rhizophagus irregularis DAOM 181602=DAOM 197198]